MLSRGLSLHPPQHTSLVAGQTPARAQPPPWTMLQLRQLPWYLLACPQGMEMGVPALLCPAAATPRCSWSRSVHDFSPLSPSCSSNCDLDYDLYRDDFPYR